MVQPLKDSRVTKIVWIVDDDKGILEALRIVLENSDYQVKVIPHVRGFKKELSISLPDLILLDIYIEDQNGREIVKMLKTSDRTKNIPVILTTADVFAIKNAKKDKHRAEEFLAKPFPLAELLALVKKYLG